MILADYIAIGLVLLFGTAGAVIGFGKGLKGLTKGIVGIGLSVISCYFLIGIVLNFNFVQELMSRFVEYLGSVNNAFCKFLLTIRIEVVSVAVVLFLLVQIIRKIIVGVIAKIMESDNKALKILNKSFGAILSITVMVALSLIVMQIIYMSNAEASQTYEFLKGSFFRLDYVYLNNPLTSIIKI